MKRSERNRQQQQVSSQKVVKEKFQHQREEFASVHPIKPMNQKQRTYIELLDTKDIVLATGLNKRYCSCYRAGRNIKDLFSDSYCL